jgi:hypothetical protein
MSDFDFNILMRNLERSTIINENPELGIYFDNAIQSAISKLKKEIDENQSHYQELENKREQLSDEYQESGIPNEEDVHVLEELGDCSMHIGWLQENLCSISEMKIVNLYKSLEIDTKHILTQIYENTDTKQFFRWDSLIGFLRTNDIEPKNLTGYRETNQLRLVNNQIKHGGILKDDIKQITEFTSVQNFTFDSLESFLNRVEQPVNDYFTSLSKKVFDDKYKFSDERINKIAANYKKRMDKEAINKLIEKLK